MICNETWKQPSSMRHTTSQVLGGHFAVLVSMPPRMPVGHCLHAVTSQWDIKYQQQASDHTPGVYCRIVGLVSTLHHARWEQKSCDGFWHLLLWPQAQEWIHQQPRRAQSRVNGHSTDRMAVLTCRRDSARANMTYVELQRTFISRSKLSGVSLLWTWMVLKNSFRCDEERAYMPTS